jgi:hypothetical protein
MMKLTDGAREFLRELLRRGKTQAKISGTGGGRADDFAVRMSPTSPTDTSGTHVGLKLEVGLPHGGDEVVMEQGEQLLAVHPVLGQLMDATTLDVVETPDGERLRLRRDDDAEAA